MTKPISIRSLPVRWAVEPSFVLPIKRRSVLSWLCCLRESAAHNRRVDVVGRPVWENGENQTMRSVRLHQSEGTFLNSIPGKGEEI
jgi:hypothetical protein